MTDPLDFTNPPTVLIVDDVPDNLTLMTAVLRGQYKTKVANSGARAILIAGSAPAPDLILLDIDMPGMDGYEVCTRLKADPATAEIPVIFLTAKATEADEQKGFDVGCVDYITKPISAPIVLARVKTHLLLKSARDFLKDQNAWLEAEVERRTREVHLVQDVTMVAMGSLAETRDNDTGNHIRRTQRYVRALAKALQTTTKYSSELDDQTIDLMFKSAPLHDIGKVGIPDHILLKPAKLDSEEFEIMKRHAVLGRDAIAAAERMIGGPSTFLRFAREMAYSHQEKWDGTGYPEGLSGDAIPLSARLMAVADVYDALISERVYKTGATHEEAVAYVRGGSGTHFDPDIVAALTRIEDEIRRIAVEFSDEQAHGG